MRIRKRFNLFFVGKTSEEFVLLGIKKYLKLLTPFSETKIVHIREEKGRDTSACLKKEESRILKQAGNFVLLHQNGQEMDSEKFAGFIEKKREINFVVGGPFGVSDGLMEKAAGSLSLSQMTFTHDMARLILLEQIYRALTILNRTGYHH